jgi:hypothetical protein
MGSMTHECAVPGAPPRLPRSTILGSKHWLYCTEYKVACLVLGNGYLFLCWRENAISVRDFCDCWEGRAISSGTSTAVANYRPQTQTAHVIDMPN